MLTSALYKGKKETDSLTVVEMQDVLFLYGKMLSQFDVHDRPVRTQWATEREKSLFILL